jgi:hypothetical protein
MQFDLFPERPSLSTLMEEGVMLLAPCPPAHEKTINAETRAHIFATIEENRDQIMRDVALLSERTRTLS